MLLELNTTRNDCFSRQFSLILSRLRNTMIFQTESYTTVLIQASASASTTDPALSLCFLLGLLHHIKASVYSVILAAATAFCKHFAGDRLPVKGKQVWCSDLHTLTNIKRLESYFFLFLFSLTLRCQRSNPGFAHAIQVLEL